MYYLESLHRFHSVSPHPGNYRLHELDRFLISGWQVYFACHTLQVTDEGSDHWTRLDQWDPVKQKHAKNLMSVSYLHCMKLLKCNWAVVKNVLRSCSQSSMLCKVVLTFAYVCGWNPSVWPFKWELLSITFMWYSLLCCTKWLKSVYETLVCGHSNENYWAVLLRGAVGVSYDVKVCLAFLDTKWIKRMVDHFDAEVCFLK